MSDSIIQSDKLKTENASKKKDEDDIKILSKILSKYSTKIIQKTIDSFSIVLYLYVAAFAVGIFLIIFSAILAIFAESPEDIVLPGIFGIGGITELIILLYKPAKEIQRSRANASQLMAAFSEWHFLSMWSGRTYAELLKRFNKNGNKNPDLKSMMDILKLKKDLTVDLVRVIEETVAAREDKEKVKESTSQEKPKSTHESKKEVSETKSCIVTASSPEDKEKNSLSFSHEGPAHREPDVKWEKSVVTYALIKGTKDIRENSDVTEKTAMNLAMLTWGLEIPLTLKLVKKDENPDITVVFKHTNEDDYLRDHPRVLGYAYPPKHSHEGILVINDDYLWSVNGEPIEAWKVDPIHYPPENTTKFKTWNLTSTLIHELGHTLGMPHIDDCPECIMYTRDNENVDLHDRDIEIIQSKYGNTNRSAREYRRLKTWLKKRIRRKPIHN